MNDTQSVEGQPWFYVLDVFGPGSDQPREAPGGNNGARAELLADAFHHAVDLGGEAVEDARLNRFDCRTANHGAGFNEFDTAQRRRVGVESIERNRDSRGNGPP